MARRKHGAISARISEKLSLVEKKAQPRVPIVWRGIQEDPELNYEPGVICQIIIA